MGFDGYSAKATATAANCDVAVALFIFNRPEKTARVFEAIRAARPARLLVVADAPKRPDQRGRCELARAAATRAVDWDCEVETHFASENLGCKRRLSTGIDWVFERAEEAIILEDDCLPHPNFFTFASSMLRRYRDNERVMMISGSNAAGRWEGARHDYFYSNYGSIWGWATWRRAWQHYDSEALLWKDADARRKVARRLGSKRQFEARRQIMDRVVSGEIDTWDYQWTFARLLRGGLSIVPSRNLVSNIGFDAEATHRQEIQPYANLPAGSLPPPYRGPRRISADSRFDAFLFNQFNPSARARSRLDLEIRRLRNLFRPQSLAMPRRIGPRRDIESKP